MPDPKGFMKFKREEPFKRPVEARVQDFREFYHPMADSVLRVQGARCMDCGVPFCQSSYGCPVENLIPDWNDLVSQGRWKEALQLLHSTNNFPEFTGKLCPAPCESACVLGMNQPAVLIRNIESSIIERGFSEGWVRPVRPKRLTGKRVAVIGSGPAGLAAAQQLVREGHSVTVYEKSDRIGGLLRYGIPDFKMEKQVLDRRLDQMIHEGVVFRTDCEVGVDVEFEEIRRRHHAICLTVGAEEPRELPVPGRDLKGVYQAMDYLTQQNRRVSGAPIRSEEITALGKRVIILGGGDTGSDCVGTAIRQGAKEVHQIEILPKPPLERSSATPWPLWPQKLRTSHAHEEGGVRHWSVSTTELIGRDGHVSRLCGIQPQVAGDKTVHGPGTQIELETEMVVLALGFTGPRKNGLLGKVPILLDQRGNIQTDSRFMTSIPGVFAAGDAKRGASLIVWAIAEGRKMATAVDRYLSEADALRPGDNQGSDLKSNLQQPQLL